MIRKRLLEVENLKINFKTYEGLSQVVQGINLEIYEGEIVGLVGETGCGKSITAKTILGILSCPPAQITGKVMLKGENLLEKTKRSDGQRFSFIPQEAMDSLNPFFTVGEQMVDYLKFPGSNFGLLERIKNIFGRRSTYVEKKAIEALRLVGIPDPARNIKNYPFELSGGMRQRFFIALSLIGDRTLIVADEPTTQLDVLTQAQILELIEQKARERKISMLKITHNLGIANALCDRIYVMYAGTIVETAATRYLFEKPAHPYTKGLLASIPKIVGHMDEGISGSIPDYYFPPSGCRFHPRCKYKMEICEKIRPELYEIEDGHKVACHLYREDGEDR